MSCNQCMGIEMEFDQKKAIKQLKQYRKEGPLKNTQRLIDALVSEGISEMTLLDIGGGIGSIQNELLKVGVKNCINIEAAQAYIDLSKEEAERQGHADRITYLHGNFVDLSKDIPQCDIVTLDRVICCYHNMEELVEKSTTLAKTLYGLVYPLDNWFTKIIEALENLFHRLQRSSFRFYIHPPEDVERIIYKNGFERRFFRKVGMWQIVVYRRISEIAENDEIRNQEG